MHAHLLWLRYTPQGVNLAATSFRVDHRVTRGSCTVLGLRGGQVVTQPLQDDEGNVLLWNGEVFGGIEVNTWLSCLFSPDLVASMSCSE